MAKMRKHNGIGNGRQEEKESVATIAVGLPIIVFEDGQTGISLKILYPVFASSCFRVFAIRLLVCVLD